MLRDAFKGERHVKGKGSVYLPPLVSHVLDGMNKPTDKGKIAYESYLMRAVFPDYVQVGVETLVGVLNAQPAKFQLPAKMEYLLKKATNKGESLDALLRRIHEQVLITGRVGLLGDLPARPDPKNPLPYMALYTAESILNWDDGEAEDMAETLNLVVLDETTNKRTGASWERKEIYRALILGTADANETKGVYKFGVFDGEQDFVEDQMTTAMLRGKPLDEIPFVFINAKDNLTEPDVPPLLGLGRLCYTIYRAEADYRFTLFMQGQDTLVVIGGVLDTNVNAGESLRVGAGARIDVNLGGDAKYIGVSSDGLSEQKEAIQNDKMAAAVRTGQLLAPGKMSMESGEALKTRVAAQTATLTSVALSSAWGLERLLRTLAKWMGEKPEEVKVVPNLDFTNVAIEGQDIVQLITAKNLGYPISYESLHKIAKARGLVDTTFAEEMALIEKDPTLLMDRAEKMAVGLKGNNALEAAGGPKKTPTQSNKTGNKPKK
jgi:hypothetical protein